MKKTKYILTSLIAKGKPCIVLLLVSWFLFLTNSCHKYPEDPFISLRRPWKRLEGTWQFTGYRIGGVDHNHDFDSLLASKTLTDLNITFSPFYNLKGEYIIKDNNGNTIHPADSHLTEYYFDTDRKFTSVKIDGDTSIFYSQLWKGTRIGYAAKTSNWKIVELYSKHLHINGNNIDIYFRKK